MKKRMQKEVTKKPKRKKKVRKTRELRKKFTSNPELRKYFLEQSSYNFAVCQVPNCGKKFSTRVENDARMTDHLKKSHKIDLLQKVSLN